MKYLAMYENYYFGKYYSEKEAEEKTDIRSLFSNLKLINYDFEDYYKFIELQKEIENIGVRFQLSYFGYTNSTESQYNI